MLEDVGYRFYFDVALDPENPQILYTGGWDKVGDSPQPLIFEVSRDGGVTWEEYKYPSDILYGGVTSVIAVKEGADTVVYLGLYGGGIVKAVML